MGGSPAWARRPPARPRRLWILVLSLAAALAVLGLVLGFFLYRPRITSLDPAFAEPGAVVSIIGANFGERRGNSVVEVDGINPTNSSYLEWSDRRLSVRFPGTIDSGLVFVVTDRGRSNPKLFMNKARLPVEPKAFSSSGEGPWLSGLSAERGQVGSLLVISGSGFGATREQRSVRFAWNPEDPPGAPGEVSSPKTRSGSSAEFGYELWSDREIRVRVPDGAVSGAIFVHAPQGDSNSLFFDVADLPGQKRYYDRRSYSMACSVNISRVQASGSNELYLWIPKPAESASQVLVRTLQAEPEPLPPDHEGLVLYRFRDLANGQNLQVRLSWLVQTYAIETRVDPDRIRLDATPSPLRLVYTSADALVPSAAPEVMELAGKIVGGERNPYRVARLVHDWLVRYLTWHEARDSRGPLAALANRTADSWNYAIIATALLRAAGVPAIPVAGLIVDPSRKTARHSWVEFNIDGFGWVPMDPILASGAKPGHLEPAFEDRTRYFANLDDRHVAFSRGWSELEPLAANGRRSSPSKPLTYQAFFEEAAGALAAYSSFWSEVEVTGLY